MSEILVLDSLFETLEVENEVAAEHGLSLRRWQGSDEELADAEAVLHVRTLIDADLIKRLGRCRVIGRFGTGLDTVDLDRAQAAAIKVVGVRDYCITELASHTLLLALSLERRVRELAGSWREVAAQTPIRGRQEATVIGFGAVGHAVAAGLAGLGYRVRIVSEHLRKSSAPQGFELVELEDGLRAGEMIFIHRARSSQAPPLIDERALGLIDSDALLINTARLGHLDQLAVARALTDGGLAGLGLDAALEPASPLSRLEGDPRVLITPHVGWLSERAAARLRRRGVRACAEALLSTHTDPKEATP